MSNRESFKFHAGIYARILKIIVDKMMVEIVEAVVI